MFEAKKEHETCHKGQVVQIQRYLFHYSQNTTVWACTRVITLFIIMPRKISSGCQIDILKVGNLSELPVRLCGAFRSRCCAEAKRMTSKVMEEHMVLVNIT